MSNSGLEIDSPDSFGTGGELVSVIIPVFNRLELLPRTLRSVLTQTYTNLEIIIVDDGSSQNVKDELDKMDDDRIHYIRHEINKGVAAAWNTGIKAASGRYITFLGSDDEWFESKVEKQILALRNRGKEYGVTYCLSEIYSDIESRVLERRAFDLEGNVLHQLLSGCVIGLNSLMLSREDALKVGEFDERLRMHSDWDFLIRLSSRYRFSCVMEVLNRDHWHEFDQITKSFRMSPEYDMIIYERNRALFEADGKARAVFFSNLAFYEGLRGKKKEAFKSIARSLLANPFTSDPYIKLVLLVTNKLEAPRIA
ncbi:MAG: glycosyltransferase family 2 protein [Methanomassiliicoccales archaeon]|nr:glycosyltransferase family 2 protein [Methanomassiliicoccales archaeon]